MSEPDKKEPWAYVRKTPEELERLAWDIVGGQVFGTWMIPPSEIHFHFMIFAFMDTENRKELDHNNIVHAYEYMDKASPRGVNGKPVFFSAQMLDKQDADDLRKRIDAIRDFQQARMKQDEPSNG